jgi:hypothetical protein
MGINLYFKMYNLIIGHISISLNTSSFTKYILYVLNYFYLKQYEIIMNISTNFIL